MFYKQLSELHHLERMDAQAVVEEWPADEQVTASGKGGFVVPPASVEGFFVVRGADSHGLV